MPKETIAIFLSLGAALSWGVAQVVSKAGLARMALAPYALVRAGFALLFAIPYGIVTGSLRFSNPSLAGMAALAGFIDSFLGTLLYMYALKRDQAHGTAALANTTPFWGVTTAVLFLGEPARLSTFIAALLVIAGAYLLISRTSGQGSHSLGGGIAALGAAVFWGVAETGPAKYCLQNGMSPAEFQLILVLTAVVTWGATVLIRGGAERPDPVGIGVAFFTAATGFFAGWILWLASLRLAEASVLAPLRAGAMTLFAFLISIVLLHERPDRRALLGAVLATSGVILVSLAA